MPVWRAYPSAISNGVNSVDRPYVDPVETIGKTSDAAATDVDVENSAFALLKGIAAGLGVPAGSGDAVVNPHAHIEVDPLDTLGDGLDPAATDPSANASATSLLKGIVELTVP